MGSEIEKKIPYALSYGLMRGAPQNYKEAIESLDDNVTEGIALDRFFNLGVMYQNGIGVPKNYDEALRYYGKAEGHARADNNLGVMFDKEQGVRGHRGHAENFYRKSLEKGAMFGQYNFGAVYYYKSESNQGQDAILDLIQAYFWVSIAVANGFYMGNNLLKHIESKMTFDDIARVQSQAKGYWESNYRKWTE